MPRELNKGSDVGTVGTKEKVYTLVLSHASMRIKEIELCTAVGSADDCCVDVVFIPLFSIIVAVFSLNSFRCRCVSFICMYSHSYTHTHISFSTCRARPEQRQCNI